MTNISPLVRPEQLKARLAQVIHGPRYANSPINFHVSIFPQRRRMSSTNLLGALTLPDQQVALRFLAAYGGSNPSDFVTIGSRIHFQPSRNGPKENVLEEIRRMPYIDPNALKEREEITAAVESKEVSIRVIQFGWECQDHVFSVEWEHQCTSARMVFDLDRREFKVQSMGTEGTRIVGIRVSHIHWASAMSDGVEGPVLFISMKYAPSFELEHSVETSPLLQQLFEALSIRERPQLRRRLSAFSQDHAPLAPYISLSLRLLCCDRNDLETFRFFCRSAHFKLEDFCYHVERRGLFAEAVRRDFNDWVSSLPWAIAFQLVALAHSSTVELKELVGLCKDVRDLLRTRGDDFTASFMRDLQSRAQAQYWYKEDDDGPRTLRSLFSDTLQDYLSRPALRTLEARETFDCFRLVVTPTTWFLEGPFPERFNRVIRLYRDHQDSFLRVTFVDENRLQYRFDREVDGSDFIRRRVRNLLVEGITIAGRHFRFLAYSQSALKEHAVWFVKEFTDSSGIRINASTIIAGLGNFDVVYDPQLIYCPARYAARISQAFTSTDASVSVEADEILILEDVKDSNGRSFMDGVGTISSELARAMWRELWSKRRRNRRVPVYPRAFQIRFGGSKGMLSVDYTLTGRVICLRRSMIKFDAPHSTVIEVARAFDKPGRYYLNRPLIMLLEGLGVQYEVFKRLQDDAVRHVEESRRSMETSARLLETHGLGSSFRLPSVFLSLHKLGVEPLMQDEFWRQMMDFAINHVLRELKHHARIPVPDGWTLVGVADVHGFLQEGEIFACVMSSEYDQPLYLEGPTLISRSPTIHPGDVQIVRAIGRPPTNSPFAQESLRNTVVFSTKGKALERYSPSTRLTHALRRKTSTIVSGRR